MTPIDRAYVQRLMDEKMRLAVELERLKLDTAEIRASQGRPDPRLTAVEAENRRLRQELETARAERDVLREGVREAIQRLAQEASARG